MAHAEQPAKKEKSPTRRLMEFGGVILGFVLGAEVLKGFFHHN